MEFRGYNIETNFEKKSIIRGSIVNNICSQFSTAKYNRDYEKCIKLSRKLKEFRNKYKSKKLYSNVNYKNSYIFEITLFESNYIINGLCDDLY